MLGEIAMPSINPGSGARKAVATIVALLLAACGPEPLAQSGVPSKTLSVVVGQKLDLKLQTIGPGEYASPPAISSPAIRFLGVAYVSPFVPAGPTQRFSFQAVAPGVAIIVFHHTDQNPTVEDTVELR
jgi:hypothetical protein